MKTIGTIVAVAVFALAVVPYAVGQSKKEKREEAATTKDCPHCLSPIPVAATRCSGCTSELQTT